jgi:signal peptidase I
MSHEDTSSAGSFFGSKSVSSPQVDGLGPVSDEYRYPVVTVDIDAGNPVVAAKPAKKSSAMREIIETLVLALIIFVAVRSLVLNFKVDGHSMAPNLQNNELLLVNRNAYFHLDINRVLNILPWEDRKGTDEWYPFSPPQRGDIVVFNPPTASDKPYIKRVIGVAGDHVSVHDGSVWVNRKELTETYIEKGITRCTSVCDWDVPAGDIFVLGDNRTNSSDSRVFGVVKVSSVIGKAWLTYWPLSDFGLVPHENYGS